MSGIPVAPSPPPIDPLVAREDKIANDTHVESELNRFIAAKQNSLFVMPDAYYRKQGGDAVDGAPQAIQRLHEIKDALLNGLANDYQRKRLGAALDAQLEVARDGISRHVAEQSKVWQRQTALDRIDLLAKEAALHHSDDDLIAILGAAAANAARAHARVGVDLPDAEIEDRTAASARSRVLAAGMQARLAANGVLASRLPDQEENVQAISERVEARPESAYSECIAECSQKFANGELPRPRWFWCSASSTSDHATTTATTRRTPKRPPF
ncbi:MAG: hypothetical protein WCP68_03755 [Enhydrobacter sp.]